LFLNKLDGNKIIGYNAGAHKEGWLVYDAFATVKTELHDIKMFQVNRDSEFENEFL